jgi:hypothetical protein
LRSVLASAGGGRLGLEAGPHLGLAELTDERVEESGVVGAERVAGQHEDGALVELCRELGVLRSARRRRASRRNCLPGTIGGDENGDVVEIEGAAQLGDQSGERLGTGQDRLAGKSGEGFGLSLGPRDLEAAEG